MFELLSEQFIKISNQNFLVNGIAVCVRVLACIMSKQIDNLKSIVLLKYSVFFELTHF